MRTAASTQLDVVLMRMQFYCIVLSSVINDIHGHSILGVPIVFHRARPLDRVRVRTYCCPVFAGRA